MANYDDGRRKGLFCLAVNLLELKDIKSVVEQIVFETQPEQPIKELAATTANLFEKMAEKRNITLKLRKKSKMQ